MEPTQEATQGTTDSERYLTQLAKHSFLSLWSYPNPYRYQQGGKELCDLLVVFEDHIIIFSDKDCEFPNSGDEQTDWNRWYKKAVRKSAEQIWGAERWIINFPKRIFIDKECVTPFPIDFPDFKHAKIHRILVAHGASKRCQERFGGGSGSLMICNDIIGDEHLQPNADGGPSFTIGQVDPANGFIHVLDDVSLDIVMQTLDTITDFVMYLSKKEAFFNRGIRIHAAGEEELLAQYLGDINEQSQHDFLISDDIDFVVYEEGFWEEFSQHQQRLTQIAVDRISYTWDAIIETFALHLSQGTQYSSSLSLVDTEKLLRFLAREPRFHRRFLSEALLNLIETTQVNRGARVIVPTRDGDPYYIFLVLSQPLGRPYEEYRAVRGELLSAYVHVIRMKYPDATNIIGFATETREAYERSEDLIYLDGRNWTPEEERETRKLQRRLKLLEQATPWHLKDNEYREKREVTPSQLVFGPAAPRNSPCSCGSGKKYKKCCGRASVRNAQNPARRLLGKRN